MRTEWLHTALAPAVMRRGLTYAAIVGPVLVGINHGDALLAGELSWPRVVKILLTFAVPYLVSTLSSVGAMQQGRDREEGQAGVVGDLVEHGTPRPRPVARGGEQVSALE